jgi:alpha-L-rhamnosidase
MQARNFLVMSAAAALIPSVAFGEPVWISHPALVRAGQESDSASLQFRQEFKLDAAPSSLEVDVSADNRFVLYVNGSEVAAGPARGDLSHWRFRRVDIARFLKRGDNVIAARVWNDGGLRPDTPFGGVKASGFGVEFGSHGLDEFVSLHVIHD